MITTINDNGRQYAQRVSTNGLRAQRTISVKLDIVTWQLLEEYYSNNIYPVRNRLINEALCYYLRERGGAQ